MTDTQRRKALDEEAEIIRMQMVPMRDGVRLATRIYLPKERNEQLPVIFWRTPYNFSELNPPNETRPTAYLKFALDAIRRGYAFVIQNERGKFFSEGEWQILGYPHTDGYDSLSWIEKQSWSAGKVATVGCSSTAEWQPALASMKHPAHAAAIAMGYGAGIGQMGEYAEQGTLFRGGVLQGPMVTWLHTYQNTTRSVVPSDMSDEDRLRLSRYTDLAAEPPAPDWKELLHTLPHSKMIAETGGGVGFYEAFGGKRPGDPAWRKLGLFHEGDDYGTPTLWLVSWFDLSSAPNIEAFNYVKQNASDASVRDSQYLIVSPNEHCGFYRVKDTFSLGERDFGDIRFGFDKKTWAFLDRYVKGEENDFEQSQPRVEYFAMGENDWKASPVWPPQPASALTLYLDSDEGANSLNGDGILSERPPDGGSDQFVYDPMSPVPSLGGNLWSAGSLLDSGVYDNRSVEARNDVLVYTSEPFDRTTEISGKIDIRLFISSDARDTDFTVKLLEVVPGGAAYNIDETIQRARYREGYNKEVFMSEGELYKLDVSPITTSHVFAKGTRLRIEVSSSNFPRFLRNLNTGGDNFNETRWVKATNAVHHTPDHRSYIRVPVIER
ncbi:MAG: CocE/NonD family hydrolase [Pseudomonadota bacterium]